MIGTSRRTRVSIRKDHVASATGQLSLPYMTSLCIPKSQPVPDIKALDPSEYEALRGAVTKYVFTRTQAVELVGHILDNVR